MCPCQLLHIFPTYFNNFTNFVHLPDPPQTPPGTPQDPLGPPEDPLGPGQTEWVHTAGSDSSSTNDVCKVEWIHTAFRLINGLQTQHQTQTVIVATQRPGGMRGAVE